MAAVQIQEGPIDVTRLLEGWPQPTTGAVNLYVGVVRGDDDGQPVERLHLEAYKDMAMRQLHDLRRETMERFGLDALSVVHRVGTVDPCQPLIVLVVHAPHRREAFEATAHFMDELKRRVPIWKQEQGPGGRAWILGDQKEVTA